MAKLNGRRTLFFINGVAPTDEQLAEAEAIPGVVCFRNAIKFREEDALEDFDGVAGVVPEKYAKEAARRAAERGDAPMPPKASPTAPAAPQAAKTGATAKPTGTAPATAWKAN
ncbi:hypothetical protein [Sphingomonas phage Kharn]|uniref:Uncharacterized protein n=1 Tax=Sphingomonas phage Kharn TaxID=2686312 RepID=A0A6M3T8A4_9CAUD|nr:hypothetical protein P9A29_gp06 [Sphingomonas phage Kharn]QJD54508.1 hypothetical protein [Sphingomonas phage Kharn]